MLQKQHTCTLGLPKTNLRYQPKNNKKSELYIAWADFLNTYSWQYYTTLTTNHSLSFNSAGKAVNRFTKATENRFGKMQIFWVAEQFDLSYSYHIHALIKFNNVPLHNSMHDEIRKHWYIVNKAKNKKGIHRTLVQNYDSALGGNFYVAKHLDKHNTNYGFSLNAIKNL